MNRNTILNPAHFVLKLNTEEEIKFQDIHLLSSYGGCTTWSVLYLGWQSFLLQHLTISVNSLCSKGK